ncbi:MAG: hypothetical protein KC476_01440 [Cyanobacteria bacterium HKST-UBA06]|nr:hypothetical protein [Cyanobacteria bacterium HKST-UBA04]MCA9806594.1 hypothetical protein [Cyanobacteria bacterium HKST-UBA06]MCA9841546.1 hypothetical protein [Cyanobacteria bacterium HKST-UBA03]
MNADKQAVRYMLLQLGAGLVADEQAFNDEMNVLHLSRFQSRHPYPLAATPAHKELLKGA